MKDELMERNSKNLLANQALFEHGWPNHDSKNKRFHKTLIVKLIFLTTNFFRGIGCAIQQ
jgi:hypothetical protein